MIYVVAKIEIADGHMDEFLAEFRHLMPQVQAEPGCLEYLPAVDVQTDLDAQEGPRGNVVTVLEKWTTLDDLKEHLVAGHMAEYREKVKDFVAGTTLHVMKSA